MAFPVAFQSTFPFLWNFFRALPFSQGTPVFMVDTLMGFSGAVVGPLKKLLSAKGYLCVGAKEIRMPGNWFPKKDSTRKNEIKIHQGLKKAQGYAKDLISGKSAWKRLPLISDFFYRLCSHPVVMNRLNLAAGRKIRVDQNRCTQCGLCARLCPVQTIRLSPFPEWGKNCQLCMRCLSFCPVEATEVEGKSFFRYRSVQSKDLI